MKRFMTVTVLNAWEQYRQNVLFSKTSKNRKTDEGRWLNHIGPAINHFSLTDVKNLHIAHLGKSLENKSLSPQTVKHCLALTKRVLRKAVEWELYSGPIPIFKMPSFDNRRIRFLNRSEAKELLETLSKHSLLWHDLSSFALYTGLRAGEILNLKVADINLDTAFVHVLDSKSGKNRAVPLNSASINIIKKYAQPKLTDILFKSDNEGYPRIDQKTFAKAVKQCGFNKGVIDRRHRVVFHTLRHTFASWLVQGGTTLAEVCSLLGHSDIKMTMRYAHLAPNHARAAVDSLQLT